MKNKTNFLAIVFIGAVVIALAVYNEWLTLETLKESIFAVTTGLGAIAALYQTLSKNEVEKENDELRHQNELKDNEIETLRKKRNGL